MYRSKIAIIVSIINRFMTSMTYALRDLPDRRIWLEYAGRGIPWSSPGPQHQSVVFSDSRGTPHKE
jgi:hypothetical protein